MVSGIWTLTYMAEDLEKFLKMLRKAMGKVHSTSRCSESAMTWHLSQVLESVLRFEMFVLGPKCAVQEVKMSAHWIGVKFKLGDSGVWLYKEFWCDWAVHLISGPGVVCKENAKVFATGHEFHPCSHELREGDELLEEGGSDRRECLREEQEWVERGWDVWVFQLYPGYKTSEDLSEARWVLVVVMEAGK